MSSNQMAQRSAASRCESKRLFTIDEAHRALPLVQRIVSDIVAQFQQLEHLQRLRQRLLRQDKSDELSGLDAQAAQGTERLNDLIEEIKLIGCQLKDWSSGLVDFPAMLAGREVYLCWRLGESKISHWHECHAGVLGRQSVGSHFVS
ncbi:MAG: DUF2203 domain-containing protein [Planctomycetes bacterium]|nr:DUF2203 domain-containing protein [Planctomycetota bacterium]